MAKKKKRTSRTSKGERRSIAKTTLQYVRAGRSEGDKMINKLNAWRKGKKGYVTIANPNPHETDKPFIKVSFDAHFGKGSDFRSMRMGSNNNNRTEV